MCVGASFALDIQSMQLQKNSIESSIMCTVPMFVPIKRSKWWKEEKKPSRFIIVQYAGSTKPFRFCYNARTQVRLYRQFCSDCVPRTQRALDAKLSKRYNIEWALWMMIQTNHNQMKWKGRNKNCSFVELLLSWIFSLSTMLNVLNYRRAWNVRIIFTVMMITISFFTRLAYVCH